MKTEQPNPFTSKAEELVKIALNAVDSSTTEEEALSKVKFKKHREIVSMLWQRKAPVFSMLHPSCDYVLNTLVPVSELKQEFLNLVMEETPFVITGYVADDNGLRQIFLRKMYHSPVAKPVKEGLLTIKEVSKRLKTKISTIEFWCETFNVPFSVGERGIKYYSFYGFQALKNIKEQSDRGISILDIE